MANDRRDPFCDKWETKRRLTGCRSETSIFANWSMTRGGPSPRQLDAHPDRLCALGRARSHGRLRLCLVVTSPPPASLRGLRRTLACRTGDHARLKRLARSAICGAFAMIATFRATSSSQKPALDRFLEGFERNLEQQGARTRRIRQRPANGDSSQTDEWFQLTGLADARPAHPCLRTTSPTSASRPIFRASLSRPVIRG